MAALWLRPSSGEIRNAVTEKAENGAFQVFKKDFEPASYGAPPSAARVSWAGIRLFRTCCKLAVVDPTGKVLDTVVIYPTAPQNKVEQAKKVLKDLIEKYHVTLISGKRNGVPGVRADHRGLFKGDSRGCALCDRKRGRGVGIFGQ